MRERLNELLTWRSYLAGPLPQVKATEVIQKAGEKQLDELKPTHNQDFTMVNWYGTEYTFALGVQSGAIKALWDEWESSGLGLNQQTICNAIDTERDSFRMANAFRNHPAVGTMIHNDGKGIYRLANLPAVKKTTKNQRRINTDTR